MACIFGKPKPAAYRKNYTPQPYWIYHRNARLFHIMKINPYNRPYK